MKLRVKILLTLIAVIFFMGLFQSLFFQMRIEKIFKNYLSESDQMRIEMVKHQAVAYYSATGSLEGVDRLLRSMSDMNMGHMGGRMGMGEGVGIIILDASGKTVADTTGRMQPGSGAAIEEPLKINGKTIGTFIAYPAKNGIDSRLEQQFVHSVNLTIIFGFLFAILITVAIGLFLSKKITDPLLQLVSGIRHISLGNTKYRVSIASKDEFRQLGEAFNQMADTLERTEKIRKSLVADVSHELRTPLSIIAAKLESIQAGALEPTTEVILHLSDEIYRLSRLVNDLQQLSLAESGRLPLQKQRTEINEFIESIVSQLEWLADEKEIALHLEKSPAAIFADLDRDRMTQVIVNLVGNALRYTPKRGKVTVRIHADGQSAVFTIQDSGPGIAEEKLPFIFERFYRADESRHREEGGAGLGLSIAKGFVEVHGGEIQATSKKGEGTVFEVTLPLEGSPGKNQQNP